MTRRTWSSGVDLSLLLEAALALLFLALFIAFYLVPAEDGTVGLPWWRTPLLVGLFFGVLALEARRRKRRAKTGLSNALSDRVPPPQEGAG